VIPVLGVMIIFAAADNVAEVFFAKDVLGAGSTGYGVLVTMWTLGMVSGSTLAGRMLRPQHLSAAVLIAGTIGGTAVLVAAGAAIYPLAVAMFFVGGAANGLELVAMRSLLHHRVPDHLRGRAFAAYYGVVQGAQIVALAASGGLVEALGARGTMMLAGAGTAAVAVLGLALYLRIGRDAARVPTAA
jgi:MFS family permease